MRAALLFLALSLPAAAQETAFDIRLTFSPGVAETLAARGERVTVAAWFYGEPSESNTLPVDEMNFVRLGDEMLTIAPGNQTVRVGTTLTTADFGSAIEPMVNINTFTARLTDEYNLITCDFIDEPLADAIATAPRELTCRLIGQ